MEFRPPDAAGNVYLMLAAQWVEYKRQVEYFAVRNRLHPYEMSLYFDV